MEDAMVGTIGLTFLAGWLAATSATTTIELTGPFHTRTPWQFAAMQGPAIADPISPNDSLPGEIKLCLSHDGQKDCDPGVADLLRTDDADTSGPHYLNMAQIVHPDAQSALFLQVGGFPEPNNNRAVVTDVLRYDATHDRFVVAYQHQTGHNNSQEVRYIADGSLLGAIVSAEPTQDAPFAFWITVNRLGADDAYHSVLRYRSATRYGDGNPLAVIDSEMPNIEQRLHLWHAGQPLPLPPGPCAKPHLVKGALWCQ
jgi:hypothetical protein